MINLHDDQIGKDTIDERLPRDFGQLYPLTVEGVSGPTLI